QRSPSSYQVMHQLLLKEVSSSDSPDGMSFDAKFFDYLTAFMAHAENRAVAGYVEILARILTKLAAGDPDVCYAALYPSAGPSSASVARGVGDEEARALTFAMLRGATSGARVYLSAPTDRDVAPPLAKALAKQHAEHPEDAAVMERPTSAS